MRSSTAVAPETGQRHSLVPERPQHKSVLTLGPKSRLALWLLVVFLELSSVILLTLWAAIYFAHNTRRSLLWVIKVFVLFSDAYQFLDQFAIYIAAGYTILAFVFLYRVVWLLYVSARNRELRFGLSTSQLNATDQRTASSFYRASKLIVRWFRKLQFLFGIHGPYFEFRFLLDEVTELVFQTIAAHASSRSISNMILNQAYGLVILINSLSSVVFQRMFHSTEDLVKQRVARVLTDLVLDFVWGTLLPVWMYQPIVKTYYEQRDHGDSIDFTENSARAVERVFVLSWWSFLMSVVPFCNSLLNLGEVRSLLREQVDGARIKGPSSSMILVTLETKLPRARRRSVDRRSRSVIHVLHGLVACTGVAIFVISLAASSMFGLHPHNGSYGCVHRVYPWFTKKEACVGRTFNCASLGLDGSANEVEEALDTFDPTTLSDLFLIDCTALNLSAPSLSSFRHLESLVVTNSTIVSWDRQYATLSDQAMPKLRTVKLKSVVFDTPPHTVALFTVPLSKSVEWVYIIDTNMSEALLRPDLVGENWRHLVFFDCVTCSLTEFPLRVVTSMGRLTMLSLMQNDIPSFPQNWPSNDVRMVMVWFDENPRLTGLSDELWRQASRTLQSVYAQDTGLSGLPGWLGPAGTTTAEFEVYAFGSPMCNSDAANIQQPPFVNCEFQIL